MSILLSALGHGKSIEVKYRSVPRNFDCPIMTDGRTDGDSLAIERSFLREEISAAVGYIEIS